MLWVHGSLMQCGYLCAWQALWKHQIAVVSPAPTHASPHASLHALICHCGLIQWPVDMQDVHPCLRLVLAAPRLTG